ncbi:histidine phosphatase family protein [uncultured Litoreibacter sp.]|uniref:histidine phosphatase family protein n=1 Tax=uncultured Litoreibacter sp. TaxID=1392394 RepID=UPI002620F074|nr:histidine phosphatase family protein [uncultured Litoreibacter sp.]
MTRWWWVRHGPTHQKTFTGWRDVPADLSDTARIERLSAYLPDDAVLITSDLQRAVKTGDAIQSGRVRLPHVQALREFDFGDWDGLHFSEVAKKDADLSRAYWETPGNVTAPNGESWNDAASRVRPVVDGMNYANHRDIIVVAHFGIILTQLQRAWGKSAYDVLAQTIEPLSVTQLTYDAGEWEVGVVNHSP